MSPRAVGVAWGLVLGGIIAADVFLARDSTSGNTWTEQTRVWASETLLVPYGLGAVLGHFFGFWLWRWSFRWLLVSAAVPAGVGLLRDGWSVEWQAVAAGAGVLVGGLLWGRKGGANVISGDSRMD